MAWSSVCWRLFPPRVATDSSERPEMDLFSPTREKFELELLDMAESGELFNKMGSDAG